MSEPRPAWWRTAASRAGLLLVGAALGLTAMDFAGPWTAWSLGLLGAGLLALARAGASASASASAREMVPATARCEQETTASGAHVEGVAAPIEIGEAIDLHGFAPRDVVSVVESYLEAAHERGLREVRLIHGRGKGVQRARVQSLLARHALVERFADAPPSRGGWGATIAWLVPPDSFRSRSADGEQFHVEDEVARGRSGT